MKSLRGALQTHFYDELSSTVDAAPERSDAEIDDAVKHQLQKIVDDAVAAFTASPMEDPDFDPEEEGLNEEADLEIVGSGFDLSTDDRPWRSQLEDALDHIKELGKAHGEAFAERICSTFYEVNGEGPTLEALTSLYGRIKTDFANEAEEELEDEEESEAEAESGIESEEDQDFGDEWDDALDHIRSIAKKDGKALAQNVCDLFNDVNGAEPSLSELHELWQSIQDSLAEEALEQGQDEEEESSDDEESDDEEAAYSPENRIDSALASEDLAEDRNHELQYFEQTMLNTPAVSSKGGRSVSWNVYFDEADLNEEAENSNLVKSVEGFKLRNQREPNQVEVHKMKLFLSVPNELVDEDEAMSSSSMIKSAVIASKRGGGASWSVDFNEASGSLENAKRAFQKMHNREPTAFEQDQIRSFLALPSAFDGGFESKQSESTQPRSPSKVLVSPVVDKKTAKRFNVYLEQSKFSQKESEQIAIKWFNRFNKREPSKEELAKIHSFIQKEADLKEQQFMVPVQALDFDGVQHGDDAQEIESETPAKSTTKAFVTKQAATGYTLNFDDEEKHNGDEEEAIKWFKRFNGRQPDGDELSNIEQFMNADQDGAEEDEDMIDIE